MNQNGPIDSAALYRISAIAGIARAFNRLQDVTYEGIEYGREPDWEVMKLCHRHIASECKKAYQRIEGLQEMSKSP